MRYALFITTLLVGLPSRAMAGTAACATILDHDSRMLCFAMETNNESYCNFIKDRDKRAYCRQIVK